jgi:hypothetical protein
MKAAMETGGSAMARVMLLRNKDAQFLIARTGVTIQATFGAGEFDVRNPKWVLNPSPVFAKGDLQL